MFEVERRKRIDEFYKLNPDKVCCDECITELTDKEYEKSSELTGLRLCPICINENQKGVKKMSGLQDYVKRNSKTVMLKDGESVEAIYQGYTVGANKYDPEKETVYYKLELPGFGIKMFSSAALGLAKLFDTIEEGTEIKLTRDGEGTKTKYVLEKKNGGFWVSVGAKGDEEE